MFRRRRASTTGESGHDPGSRVNSPRLRAAQLCSVCVMVTKPSRPSIWVAREKDGVDLRAFIGRDEATRAGGVTPVEVTPPAMQSKPVTPASGLVITADSSGCESLVHEEPYTCQEWPQYGNQGAVRVPHRKSRRAADWRRDAAEVGTNEQSASRGWGRAAIPGLLSVKRRKRRSGPWCCWVGPLTWCCSRVMPS
jgi:hypothetical protein